MSESPEHRLKRLRMRSWRRGMKEMDLILGGFADARLEGMDGPMLADYELLLNENDQDLYKWVSRALPTPDRHAAMIDVIAGYHKID